MSWRNTRDYRVWRAKVIRRDKRCYLCGTLKNRQAHHINSGSYFKDIRFDVNNGVTLCRKCHSEFHSKFMGSFRKKCTTKDFERFIHLVDYLTPVNICYRIRYYKSKRANFKFSIEHNAK